MNMVRQIRPKFVALNASKNSYVPSKIPLPNQIFSFDFLILFEGLRLFDNPCLNYPKLLKYLVYLFKLIIY